MTIKYHMVEINHFIEEESDIRRDQGSSKGKFLPFHANI